MLFASRPTCIKRLLIIEDDPLTAFDNEHTLKHGGYQVVATVDSGEAAVAVMAAEPVDALVLDLGLAGHMTGREVARQPRHRGAAGDRTMPRRRKRDRDGMPRQAAQRFGADFGAEGARNDDLQE